MNILTNAHILQVGDSAIEIRLGDQIDGEVNQRVYWLDHMISRAEISGVIEIIPSYASLLIIYDPLLISRQKLCYELTHFLKDVSGEYLPESRLIEIPVVYGGADGPDLMEVARLHSLSVDEVISIHCGTEYRVYMMGFTPGFPYLGDLSPLLSTPRLAQPRKVVPAGSIGIAGNQTGIYPIQSPGGWRIIGRTYLHLFDPNGDPPFLIRPGDRIRFIPVMEHSA